MFDNISSISYGNSGKTRPFINPLNLDIEKMRNEQNLSTNLKKEKIAEKIDDNISLVSALVECKDKINGFLSCLSPNQGNLLNAIAKKDLIISNNDAIEVVYSNLFEDFEFTIENINIPQKQKTSFVLPSRYISEEDTIISFFRIINDKGITINLEKNYIFESLDGCVFYRGKNDDQELSYSFDGLSCHVIKVDDDTVRIHINISTDNSDNLEVCFKSNDIALLHGSIIAPNTKIRFTNNDVGSGHILKNFNLITKNHDIFCNDVVDFENDLLNSLNGMSIFLLYEVDNKRDNNNFSHINDDTISKISILSHEKIHSPRIHHVQEGYCMIDEKEYYLESFDNNSVTFQSESGNKLLLEGCFDDKSPADIALLLRNSCCYELIINSGENVIEKFKKFDKNSDFLDCHTLSNKVVIQSKYSNDNFNFEIENLDSLNMLKDIKHIEFQNANLLVDREFVELEDDLFKMENNFGTIVLRLISSYDQKIFIKSSINLEKLESMIRDFVDSYNDFHTFIKKQNAVDNNYRFLDDAILGKNHIDWNKKIDIAFRKIDLINLGIKNSSNGFFKFDKEEFSKSIKSNNINKMVEQLKCFYDEVYYIVAISGGIDTQIHNLNKKRINLHSEQSNVLQKSKSEEEKFLINIVKANAAYIKAMNTIDMMEKIMEIENNK